MSWLLPLLPQPQGSNQLPQLKMWGQAGVDFTTCSSKKARSEEIVPMAFLIKVGIGKGKLGVVTVFCHSDQVNMEPLVTLPTLIHWDSHEPAMVVMKIFTNFLYFPSFGLSFLDIATLSEVTPTIWFPLLWLCLCQLPLYSSNQVILP